MNGSVFTVPGNTGVECRMVENVGYWDSPRPPYTRPVPDADGDIFIPNRSVELDGTLPED